MNYLIGIDVGTSATKTVLFDENGQVIASASREYPMEQPHNGWAQQRPEGWRDAVLETLAKVKELSGADSKDIKGIGISGQMHGLVMLDENGQVDGAVVYHAGTALRDGKFVTNGGRVLGVTALGNTLPQALEKAYAAVGKIHWDGVHYRHDIGVIK